MLKPLRVLEASAKDAIECEHRSKKQNTKACMIDNKGTVQQYKG